MIAFAFWFCIAVIVYVYVGYPALAAVVGTLRHRHVHKQPITPNTTLIIAAYNEEQKIAERLDNALDLDYPRSALQIIVASDGSTDGTEEIVARYADRGVDLLRLPRRGKNQALDSTVRYATGDILIFSDANTLLAKDALRKLVRNFADSDVGGVAGAKVYRLEQASDAGSRGEDLYWRYDSWLKQMESDSGSVVSADGALYALRRELYQALGYAAGADDVAISTASVAQGCRLVYESEARAYEAAMPASDREFRRKVRIISHGLRALSFRRRLFNPFRFGFYSIALVSRKVVRRLVPYFLIALLVLSFALSPVSRFYTVAAGAQLGFYGLALLGYLLRRTALGKLTLLYVPLYYCLVNIAALIATIRFLGGEKIEYWEPQRHGTGT